MSDPVKIVYLVCDMAKQTVALHVVLAAGNNNLFASVVGMLAFIMFLCLMTARVATWKTYCCCDDDSGDDSDDDDDDGDDFFNKPPEPEDEQDGAGDDFFRSAKAQAELLGLSLDEYLSQVREHCRN